MKKIVVYPQEMFFLFFSLSKQKKFEEVKKKPKFPPITEKPKNLTSNIHSASMNGDLFSVQWFIEKECVNVDERDSGNWTPLILASSYSNNHPNECHSIVEYLIEKGADVNAKNKDNCTALHFAKTLEVAKTLVEHGADIESVNDFGNTPLILQSRLGRVDIVKYLLSVGAKDTRGLGARYGFGSNK